MKKAVFVPGFLCDPRVWHLQVEALKKDLNCEVLDLRYCQDLDDMVQQVAKISAPTFNLVGFSMGGYVAQVFATRFPERLESLCIVASSGTALSETDKAGRKRMESVLKVAKYKGISPKEMSRYVHPQALDNHAITDLIISMSATNTSEMYLNQMRATLEREDYRHILQAAPYPMAIYGGADDRVATRPELESLAAGIPRAEFKLLPECGHYVPLEKPAELTALLRDFIL